MIQEAIEQGERLLRKDDIFQLFEIGIDLAQLRVEVVRDRLRRDRGGNVCGQWAHRGGHLEGYGARD